MPFQRNDHFIAFELSILLPASDPQQALQSLTEAKKRAETEDRRMRVRAALRRTAKVLRAAGRAAIVAGVAAGIAAARAEGRARRARRKARG